MLTKEIMGNQKIIDYLIKEIFLDVDSKTKVYKDIKKGKRLYYYYSPTFSCDIFFSFLVQLALFYLEDYSTELGLYV
jgi:hypothetical protein